MQERRPTIDGVKLAIMHKRFEGVTRKMANTLLRTARSGVINTARDFSCAIVTAECELLTAVESYPIHVLGGADLMTRAMLDIHPDVRPGDAFLHNSPYHGNTHAADATNGIANRLGDRASPATRSDAARARARTPEARGSTNDRPRPDG